jgi:Ni,Fe-hydrogenase I cytochrome b subunit
MTDRYLLMLWRKAVLITRDHRCYICDQVTDLECHHFIKRKIRVLRYDWRNGFPLCLACHQLAHISVGYNIIANKMGRINYEYLIEMERYTLKQYLFEKCISRAEWEAGIVKELKSIIAGAD